MGTCDSDRDPQLQRQTIVQSWLYERSMRELLNPTYMQYRRYMSQPENHASRHLGYFASVVGSHSKDPGLGQCRQLDSHAVVLVKLGSCHACEPARVKSDTRECTWQVDGLSVGLDDVTRPNHLAKQNAKLSAELSHIKVAADSRFASSI